MLLYLLVFVFCFRFDTLASVLLLVFWDIISEFSEWGNTSLNT